MKNYCTPEIIEHKLQIPYLTQYLLQLQDGFPTTTACGTDLVDSFGFEVSEIGGTITISVQPDASLNTFIVNVDSPSGTISFGCVGEFNGAGTLDEFTFSPTEIGIHAFSVVNPSPGLAASYTLTVSSTLNNIASPIGTTDDACIPIACP